jgi:hypothetical protein
MPLLALVQSFVLIVLESGQSERCRCIWEAINQNLFLMRYNFNHSLLKYLIHINTMNTLFLVWVDTVECRLTHFIHKTYFPNSLFLK